MTGTVDPMVTIPFEGACRKCGREATGTLRARISMAPDLLRSTVEFTCWSCAPSGTPQFDTSSRPAAD